MSGSWRMAGTGPNASFVSNSHEKAPSELVLRGLNLSFLDKKCRFFPGNHFLVANETQRASSPVLIFTNSSLVVVPGSCQGRSTQPL